MWRSLLHDPLNALPALPFLLLLFLSVVPGRGGITLSQDLHLMLGTWQRHCTLAGKMPALPGRGHEEEGSEQGQ